MGLFFFLSINFMISFFSPNPRNKLSFWGRTPVHFWSILCEKQYVWPPVSVDVYKTGDATIQMWPDPAACCQTEQKYSASIYLCTRLRRGDRAWPSRGLVPCGFISASCEGTALGLVQKRVPSFADRKTEATMFRSARLRTLYLHVSTVSHPLHKWLQTVGDSGVWG